MLFIPIGYERRDIRSRDEINAGAAESAWPRGHGRVAWSTAPLGRRSERDGVDDLGVASAPAEVAGDRIADPLVGRLAAAVEEGSRGHQHPRRADAALRAAGNQERVLEGIELVPV